MPLQGFRRLKSGNPHEYWAEACKRDDFQWITVELGSIGNMMKEGGLMFMIIFADMVFVSILMKIF
jgi:hypothetical protein